MPGIEPWWSVSTATAELVAAANQPLMAQNLDFYRRHISLGGAEADRMHAQSVRGQWIFYWAPVIDELKRRHQLEDALDLSLECINCAKQSLWIGGTLPHGWWEKAAIIARLMRRYDLEASILEDFLALCPENGVIQARLKKAHVLYERSLLLKQESLRDWNA